MNNRQKENSVPDFMDMVSKSWTWAKMTEKEQTAFSELVYSAQTTNTIKGSYENRHKHLNLLYYAYLFGLGYNDFNWRQSSNATIPLF